MVWDVAMVGFDHPHVTSNLRWIDEHPDARLVALCDEHPETALHSMAEIGEEYDVTVDRQFTDLDACLAKTSPGVVVLCPDNVEHGNFTERAAAAGAHVIVEKPFAYDLAEADRMVAACEDAGVRLAVNWPYTWAPSTRTMKRVVDEGRIGDVLEVHFYGGNRGPPPDSWFYDPERGGGSLVDFAGYGAVFATWFRDGELPTRVTARSHVPDDLDVDTQSVTILEYDTGLSTVQTTWQSFANPWERATQPPNGFTVVGSEGTITSRTSDGDLRIQTADDPDATPLAPDDVDRPDRNVIEHVLHRLETGEAFGGPTAPALSRKGQRIVDAARRSLDLGSAVDLDAAD